MNTPGFWSGPEPYPALIDDTNQGQVTITVSRSFHPQNTERGESNLILCSTEGVLFYVHTHIINNVSQRALQCFFEAAEENVQGDTIMVPETTAVLNIIIHTIYNTSCAQHSPKCEELIEAVDKMPRYGLTPKAIVFPGSPLYDLLLSHGVLRPIDIYSLAAHHDIAPLAEQVSSHLLAYPLSNMSDQIATRMGAIYLRRLFALHIRRIEELKKILRQPPLMHPATQQCDFESQGSLARAWALGTTYIGWEMRPGPSCLILVLRKSADLCIRATIRCEDLSIHMMKNVLGSLGDKLKCRDCKEMLDKRIRDALVSWAAVKCTISFN